MKKLLSITLCFLAFATTYANNPADSNPKQQTVNLQFKPKQGDVFVFNQHMAQTTNQEAMGQSIEMTQNVVSVYRYDVTSVTDAVSHIKVTYERMALEMETNTPMIPAMKFDTEKPEEGNTELKVLGNLIGKSFQIEVEPTGRVTKIEGLSEIIESLGAELGASLGGLVNDETMTQSLNIITYLFPAKPVKAGDQWTTELSGPLAGMMHSEVQNNFTLKEIEGDLAILDLTSNLQLSELENIANPMLQGAKIDFDGTQTGTIEVDLKTGLAVSSTLEQAIKGNISIMGMDIPSEIKITTTTTGEKL